MARNKIRDLDALKWSLPGGLVLEQLHLESNPVKLGRAADSTIKWPLTKQFFISNMNIQSLNVTHMVFKVCFFSINLNINLDV